MNRSNSSHVPLLPRLPLPHSMKDDGVRPNPLKMIKALEGVSSIYDNLTSVKKALNRSEKLCISPERGLQKAIRTDSLKIRPFSFSELNRAPLANTSSTDSARSTAIQPVPIDLESNPPEDLDIRSNGPKLLKWIIGASLLLVTLAAAKTSFN
ncbi:hypothetical protein M9H77_00609 [Catharanthus roseus]|nr:hypothetical protein M9H77_00609 [Catharanthus roseus]